MTRHNHIGIRSENGQTAVEFALVTPMLLVLLLAVIQVGVAFNHYVTLTDAARAGARKAIVTRVSGGSVADVEQSIRDAASGMNSNLLEISVDDPTWNVAGSDVTVTVKYPFQIDLLGWVVASGKLTSTMTERLE